MLIAICSNISNQIGLQREYELLKEFLSQLGHEVIGLQYDEPLPEDMPPCDLMITLETVSRHLMSAAPVHWLFPNPEWVTNDLIPVIRQHFDKVLTKTLEGQRIFEPLFPGKTFCTGFLTRDQMDENVSRERKFLHIGGNSILRNTQAVLDAWRWKQYGEPVGAELTIVSQRLKDADLPEGVTVFDRVSEEELKRLQNSHAFHLYPSGTEGFGHALHEALSVNATILITFAPPMNEVHSVGAFVKSTGDIYFNLAKVHEVSALDIHLAAKKMLGFEYLASSTGNPRQEWRTDNEQFREFFGDHLAKLNSKLHPPKVRIHEFIGQKRIAFLGNFRHSFCTESDLAWSAEHMGHEVIRIQEDLATFSELTGAVLDADLFLWVHTHGWNSVTDADMHRFLEFLRKMRIPSVFFHLDRYWGIPEREELIGVSPCWKCDYVFTADGGNEERFRDRGVNHFWLPPAIVERAIHYGFARTDLRCDVAFVGAGSGYHAIYPFRQQLLDFLKERYGGRFKHFQGKREAELNDVCYSAKVVVGDHIFAGQTPRYWSDRLPESAGRGAFLIYPKTEGMTIPCATYTPQSLSDLDAQIDYWLEASPQQRRAVTEECMATIRANDTYGHRVEQILNTVYGGD